MRVFLLLLLLASACGDNIEPEVADPTTCDDLTAITVDATDVGEVMLGAYVRTPGISYHCDNETTWSYWARRRIDDGRLGSYGRFVVGSDRCAWFDAIDERTPAVGGCD